jgi:hypothetical protein
MKSRYKKLGAHILRPVIPIDILSGSEMVRYYDQAEVELKRY